MATRIPVTLTLLFVVLSSVGALEVSIPQKEYEKARGDNITLPCSFKTNVNPLPFLVATWSAEGVQAGAQENLVLSYFYPKKLTEVTPKYKGRATLDVNIPKGRVDLNLNSITLADNKEFECRLLIIGDNAGTLFATTRLVVLVAPSTPVCKIQGKAEYGQNINLTCHSDEGSPPPEYTWESRDVRNMPRVGAPRIPPKGAILSLFNISKETSGYYTCTSKNKIRSATCNITLSVMPPSVNIGATAGIVAAVVAALIVLIIIIYCCCCRKKEQKEDYAMGVREGEEYRDREPDVNGENRRPERQVSSRSEGESDVQSADDRRDRYEERSERDYDRRRDYDDRQSDYDDRRSDYNDRRNNYDDQRSDYDDRHDRYSDRRERYDDDRRYDDERRYNDRRDYADDRYDEPYDAKPAVPANKPSRDYDD